MKSTCSVIFLNALISRIFFLFAKKWCIYLRRFLIQVPLLLHQLQNPLCLWLLDFVYPIHPKLTNRIYDQDLFHCHLEDLELLLGYLWKIDKWNVNKQLKSLYFLNKHITANINWYHESIFLSINSIINFWIEFVKEIC